MASKCVKVIENHGAATRFSLLWLVIFSRTYICIYHMYICMYISAITTFNYLFWSLCHFLKYCTLRISQSDKSRERWEKLCGKQEYHLLPKSQSESSLCELKIEVAVRWLIDVYVCLYCRCLKLNCRTSWHTYTCKRQCTGTNTYISWH